MPSRSVVSCLATPPASHLYGLGRTQSPSRRATDRPSREREVAVSIAFPSSCTAATPSTRTHRSRLQSSSWWSTSTVATPRSGDVGQHATPPGHTGFVPRPVSWTDQQLIDAVDVSTSFKQVCDRLGLWAGGGTYRTLERHMARLNLETTHLERQARRKSRRAWTDYDLAVAVRESVSYSEVGRRLGYITSGGVHRFVKRHIARLGLDTSHFVGQSWAKGRSFAGQRKRPLSEILVQNSTYMSTGRLRRRLITEGLKPACCEMCEIATWRGKPLPLELDHINGDHADNRIENLRIVCPNCHAVTETWCRSPRGRCSPIGRGPSFRATSVRVRVPPPAPQDPRGLVLRHDTLGGRWRCTTCRRRRW